LDYQNIDVATSTAIYYGFTPIEIPTITKDDLAQAKAFRKEEGLDKDFEKETPLLSSPEERVSVLRTYVEKNMIALPQPVMLVYNGFIEEGKNRKSTEKKISLEFLGSSKGVAEAVAVKTALAILTDYGAKELMVEINSIGDKESCNRFARELTSYYRKNINQLPAHCRQNFKKDVFSLLHCDNKACQNLKEEAPKSLSCLSDASREHFREVLEYLEKMEIPYEIHNCLVGNRHYGSQTFFNIRGEFAPGKTELLGTGFRYDGLAKKIGLKKEVSGLAVKLHFKNKLKSKDIVKKIRKPRLYFIQLGFEAKHKALSLIETLRQHDILVYQSLSRDKMGSQLVLAEKMRIPFVIIMGKKEAMENTVMIRNLKNRSQQTISIEDLPAFIKNSEWY
jgi:histidyl-tRNA synthetase